MFVELKFTKVDAQKRVVLLENSEGDEFSLPYSDELRTALADFAFELKRENDNTYDIDISEPHTLTPREIQSRIRAGMTAEEIEKRFGIDAAKVQRYSVQVEGEKAVIIEQFQHLPARTEKKGRDLIEIVNEYFDDHDVDRTLVNWTATRNEKEPWVIRLYFKIHSSVLIAIWTWDPRESIIAEVNEIAKEISQYYTDIASDTHAPKLKQSGKKFVSIASVETDQNAVASREELSFTTTALINNSSGLRLRELRNLQSELDDDFKVLSSAAPRLTVTSVETKVDEVTEPEPLAKVEKPAKKSPEKPVEKAPNEVSTKSTEKNIEENSTQKMPTETAELDGLNITGKLRTRFGRGKSKRKVVPGWDEVMFSSSVERETKSE